MNKWGWTLVAAVLLAVSAPSMRAADEPAEKKPAREEADKRKEDWKKLSPEEREAKRMEIKGRLEKRICELRTKQTNNTITAQEIRDLARSEQILKRFETNGPPVLRGERVLTNTPAAPAPPEK
jgi:acyl-CoA reductase-like NAD-dependent aldehyde dehydrogenase